MAKFEIFRDADGDYRWRLRSSSGQICAIGDESFTTRAGVENRIAMVKRDAAAASILDVSASPVPTAAVSSRMEPGIAKKKLPPPM
jgi:uncharacterized protein YegP (UPF0339 family)